MKYESKNANAQPEILKVRTGAEYFKGITITDASLASTGVVKAGTPISAAGAIANTADAVGILFEDVFAENPNGSLVVGWAVINLANAQANSGLTIASAAKTALKHLIFE